MHNVMIGCVSEEKIKEGMGPKSTRGLFQKQWSKKVSDNGGRPEQRPEGNEHGGSGEHKCKALRQECGWPVRGIAHWYQGRMGENTEMQLRGARDQILNVLVSQKDEWEFYSKCRQKPGHWPLNCSKHRERLKL